MSTSSRLYAYLSMWALAIVIGTIAWASSFTLRWACDWVGAHPVITISVGSAALTAYWIKHLDDPGAPDPLK